MFYAELREDGVKVWPRSDMVAEGGERLAKVRHVSDVDYSTAGPVEKSKKCDVFRACYRTGEDGPSTAGPGVRKRPEPVMVRYQSYPCSEGSEAEKGLFLARYTVYRSGVPEIELFRSVPRAGRVVIFV